MASKEQIAANRRNAENSTGPRTPEGKTRCAQNARKHGFFAATFAVVRLEELDEVARLKDDLVACYQPVNSQELFAIERMAIAQQTMLRAARLESGLCTSALDESLFRDGECFTPMQKALAQDIEVTHAQNCNFALAYGFQKMAESGNTWALCMRYKNEAERHYRRAQEEFDRIKKLRAELPNDPNFYLQPDPEPVRAESPIEQIPNRPDSPQPQPNTPTSTDSCGAANPGCSRLLAGLEAGAPIDSQVTMNYHLSLCEAAIAPFSDARLTVD